MLIIVDETVPEGECDTIRKERQEKSTGRAYHLITKMGQDGKRRNTYSAAVIDGIKRKARIYARDSIVRKTDVRLIVEKHPVYWRGRSNDRGLNG